MKPEPKTKKLSLMKQTIVQLNGERMNAVRGGTTMFVSNAFSCYGVACNLNK